MKKQPCWVDSNGVPHLSREECQKAEIEILYVKNEPPKGQAIESQVSEFIIVFSEHILNILTMKDDSRPGARGVKKPRKAKSVEMPQSEKAA